jgi:hypothetical protein
MRFYINPAQFVTALTMAADEAEARTTCVGTSAQHAAAVAEAATLRTLARLVLECEAEAEVVAAEDE